MEYAKYMEGRIMEIEVGMYVRTKYGISQYKCYETSNGKLLCIPVKNGSQGVFANIEDISKASNNIIDLIEEGDYVNGERVIGFGAFCYDDGTIERTSLTLDITVTCLDSEIKSIVTKEQFESCMYKVGE